MRFDRFRRTPGASAPRRGAPQTLRALTLSLLLLPLAGQAAPRAAGTPEPLVAIARRLPVPQALRAAKQIGRMPAQENVQVALSLPWRDSEGLDALIRRQSDPADPLYEKFLTAQQFAARFAPTEADYAALKAWGAANGLAVTDTTPSRSLLVFTGKRDAVEAGFHVQLNQYRLATGRVVYVNDTVPTLPQSIARRVAGVVGLTNLPKKEAFRRDRQGLTPNGLRPLAGGLQPTVVGTGPGGGLTPADIRSLYNFNPLSGAGLDGSGQTIALYEQNGYIPSDITTYATAYGLGTPSLSNVTIGNYNGAVTDIGTQGEVTLDIEMVLAVAPRAKIIVYEFDDTSLDTAVNPLALLTRIATDDLAEIVSVSYGGPEEDAELGGVRQAESSVFKQMAAQGQSVFASSGDTAAYLDLGTPGAPAYVQSVSDPAVQPLVTAVGGTTLSSAPLKGTPPVATYGTETNWFTTGLPTPDGAGGGTSKYVTKPDYQTGVGASATMRDLPDVSLNADPNTGYSVFQANTGLLTSGGVAGYDVAGGTSASCPLWAAFFALVNQQRQIYSLPKVGFTNPGIYAAAKGPNYAGEFHDIKDNSTNGVFNATAGFDDCTGWGTLIAGTLLSEFAPTTFGAGVITFRAVDAAGNPVAGVAVAVTTPQVVNYRLTGTTAANGTLALTVPTGVHNFNNTGTDAALTFNVSATAVGQSVQIQPASVVPPATVTLTLRAPDHTYPSGTLQMISSPFEYSTVGDFATLFGLTPPLAVTSGSPALFAWSPASGGYLRYPIAPADTLRIGQGYWGLLPANAYTHLSGVPLAASTRSYRITLLPGWNMIGDPYLGAAPISGLQVDGINPGTPVAIGAAPTVQLPFYHYNGSAYQALGASDSLQPFQGYWIHATQAAQLVIPAP